MFQNISDTVLIPHPNTVKILSDIQKSIINNEDSLFVPVYPLYIPADFLRDRPSVKQAVISRCIIKDNSIVCPVTVLLNDRSFKSEITLAERLDLPEKKDCSIKEQSFGFPLNLTVFRVADLDINNLQDMKTWSIKSEKWYKIRKQEV